VQTLASHIVRAEGLPAVAAVGWIIRLARTLEPIHELGVAHGGLTADALLSDGPAPGTRGQILAPRLIREQAAFHGPERAAGEGASPEDDTWAASVLLYFALANALPFPGDNDRDVRRRIVAGKAPPLATYHAGDDKLQEIMDRALSRSVLERITSLSSLREALEDWHPHPAARDLPPLEHEGSLLLALCPAPAPATPAPAAVQSAPVSAPKEAHPLSRDVLQSLPRSAGGPQAGGRPPVIHEEEEEEDAPTRVRDVPMLLAQLSLLQRSDPPEPGKPVSDAPRSAADSAELSWRTPVAPAPGEGDAIPASAPLLPFDRESAPGNIAVSNASETGSSRIQLDRASAPVLPLFRDSAPGDVPVTAAADSSAPRIELDRPSAPILPFDRESAVPQQARPAEARNVGSPSPGDGRAPVESPRPDVAPKGPSGSPTVSGQAPSTGSEYTSAPEAAVAPPAPTKPRSQPLTTLALGLAAATAAGLAFFFLRSKDPPVKDPGNTGNTAPSGVETAPLRPTATAPTETAKGTSAAATDSASAPPVAAETATATVEPTATATATAAVTAAATTAPKASGAPTTEPSAVVATAQEGAGACMMPFFATGTFVTAPTGLDAACKITDPREGVKLVKLQTILAGENKRLSDGMREWAIIGWYGMPAFEILRTTCCASPPEVRIPFKDPACDLEGALKRLTKSATTKSADDAEIAEALKAYTKAVICTSNSGASGVFNQAGGIVEGELVTFQKTLTRVRAGLQSK